MFTVLRFFGFLPCFLQNFEGAGFHIQANGIGSTPRRRETIADKIVFIFKQGVDNIVNQRGIDDGTIRGDADNHIRFGFFRGLIVTVEHIVETAAREGDSAEVAVLRHGVVGWDRSSWRKWFR